MDEPIATNKRGNVRFVLCEDCRACPKMNMYRVEDITPDSHPIMQIVLEDEPSNCVVGVELLDDHTSKPAKYAFGICGDETKECLVKNLRRIVNISWMTAFAQHQRQLMEHESLARRAQAANRFAPMGRKAHKRMIAKEKARLKEAQKKSTTENSSNSDPT